MLLALWLCGLLGNKNLSGATNLIDRVCQTATRYFWSLLTDAGFELLKGFTSRILLHIILYSLCRTERLLKHRWLRNNSADHGKLYIRKGKSLWLSL